MSFKEELWGESLAKKAELLLGGISPWPGYFEFKAKELKTIIKFCRLDKAGSVLEIGCGNGFTSALLSSMARKVTAFDLPSRVQASHTLGIEYAEKLVAGLGIRKVEVVSGRAEEMPFPDGSFDMVFSEYMLQYVKDKDAALKEIRRVLKDSGVVITIVPNFMERVFAPLLKYEYLLIRLPRYISGAMRKKSASSGGVSVKAAQNGNSTGLVLRLDDWFFLRPDGPYKSFMEEMARHTPWRWKRLFEANGFSVKHTFSTQLVPLGIFDIFTGPSKKLISRWVDKANKALGNKPVLKSLGYSLGLVAVKGEER